MPGLGSVSLYKMSSILIILFCASALAEMNLRHERNPCVQHMELSSEHMIWTTNENNEEVPYYKIHSSMIKLHRDGALCLKIPNSNFSLDISLKYIQTNCLFKNFLYAIPLQPEIECETVEDGSIFNSENYEECKNNKENSIKKKFPKQDISRVISSSCENAYGFWRARSIWWISELKQQNLDKFLKVYKCVEEQKIIHLEVSYPSDTNPNLYVVEDIAIKEKEPFTYKYKNNTFVINDLSVSTNVIYGFNDVFYITDPYDRYIGLVDSANTLSSFTPGMIGEIRCDLTDSGLALDINTCKVSYNILNIKVDSYTVNTCTINHLDYMKLISDAQNSPPSNNIEIINYKNNPIIRYKHPSFLFNFRSTIKLLELQAQDTCKIVSQDINSLEPIVYNKTSNFTIQVSNKGPILISFNCDEEFINIPGIKYDNKNNIVSTLQVKFYPVLKFVDTTCKIFCGSEIKSVFKIKANFVNKEDHPNIFAITNTSNGKIKENDITKNTFIQCYEAVKDFIVDTWDKIVAGISSFLILVVVIIGVLVFLGRFPWSCCCCCCKKWVKRNRKNNKDDEDLNNVVVFKNKKSNNKKSNNIELSEMNSLIDHFYAYNGESIEIINEDYSINDRGIYYKNNLIVHSIPHVIFYKNIFIYKNNKIFLKNQVIVDNVKGSKKINSNYILENSIIYNFDDFSKPLMMLRSNNLSNMQILDSDYTRIGNDLYYEEHEIIKNIFLDIDDV